MRAPKILMAIGMLWIFSTTSLISCGGGGKTTTYTISGTVSGDIAAGVDISLGGAKTATTTTGESGAYTIGLSGLANGSYTVTPSLTGYTFAPVSLDVVVSNANVTGQNFVATKNVSCDEFCAKIGGTDAGECNSSTNTTIPACTTECNNYDSIVTTDTFNKIGNCILTATCDINMLQTCLTQVATSITNDNVTTVEDSVCGRLVFCQTVTDNPTCLSLIDTVLGQYTSYLSLIKLIDTSTIDCFTTCFSSQSCLTSQEILQVITQINTCLTQCQIPTQL